MDAERFIGAFSKDEQAAIAAAIPEDIILSEARRRNLQLGTAVTQYVEVVEDSTEIQLTDAIDRFVNITNNIEVTEQLKIMSDFWANMGYEVPALDEKQKITVSEALKNHPGGRVVPTPLLGLVDRKKIADRAQDLIYGESVNEEHILWAPKDGRYHDLMEYPDSTVTEGDKTFGIRYKSPEGKLVNRSDYLQALKNGGYGIESSDGTLWIFPVMDLEPKEQHHDGNTRDVYDEKISFSTTPESLITTELLQWIAGSPAPKEWNVELANEAIFEIDENGLPSRLNSIAGVHWKEGLKQIRWNSWPAGYTRIGFGNRETENALVRS